MSMNYVSFRSTDPQKKDSTSSSSCSTIGDVIASYIEDPSVVAINKRNTQESRGVMI